LAKATAKGGSKMVAFDMNEGLIGSLPIPGQNKGNTPATGAPI